MSCILCDSLCWATHVFVNIWASYQDNKHWPLAISMLLGPSIQAPPLSAAMYCPSF